LVYNKVAASLQQIHEVFYIGAISVQRFDTAKLNSFIYLAEIS